MSRHDSGDVCVLDLIGERVRIELLCHVFEEDVDRDAPIAVVLRDGDRRCVVRGSGDGETLLFERNSPEPIDMGEWGATALVPWADLDDRYSDTEIRRVALAMDAAAGGARAVGLEFHSGVLWVVEWGDNLELVDGEAIQRYLDESCRIEWHTA